MTFVFSFCDCYCAKVASAHVATQTSRTSSQVVGNIEKGETPATRHEETSHMALKGSQQALKKQPKTIKSSHKAFTCLTVHWRPKVPIPQLYHLANYGLPCSTWSLQYLQKHIVATSAKLLSSCCCHNFGEKIFRPRSGPHCQSLCASKPLQPPCLHTAQHHPCLLCQLDWSKPHCKCTQVKLGALAAGWSPSCLACTCLSTLHALQNFLLAAEHADLVHKALRGLKTFLPHRVKSVGGIFFSLVYVSFRGRNMIVEKTFSFGDHGNGKASETCCGPGLPTLQTPHTWRIDPPLVAQPCGIDTMEVACTSSTMWTTESQTWGIAINK